MGEWDAYRTEPVRVSLDRTPYPPTVEEIRYLPHTSNFMKGSHSMTRDADMQPHSTGGMVGWQSQQLRLGFPGKLKKWQHWSQCALPEFWRAKDVTCWPWTMYSPCMRQLGLEVFKSSPKRRTPGGDGTSKESVWSGDPFL